MATTEQAYLRTALEHRRSHLHQALRSHSADIALSKLLQEVDAALVRFDLGTFGLCENCHDRPPAC
jgi:RNA polymerase-binding transcription factor DksA